MVGSKHTGPAPAFKGFSLEGDPDNIQGINKCDNDTQLNETGMEMIHRYLPGTTGANKGGLRRFIEAVQNDMTDEEQEEYNEWLSFLLDFLPGQKVRVKSEFNTFQGKTSIKQVIVGLNR